MPHSERKGIDRRTHVAALALLIGLMFTACGSNASRQGATLTSSATGPAPATGVVVRVGATPITGAIYDHWMAVGAATVELPRPGAPTPTPTAYEPPEFAACRAHLQTIAPKSTTTARLKAECERTYEGIRTRILNFLITGYWLRREAAEQHASVTAAEVHKKFDEEKRINYPTPAAFRKLQETSRQTVPDLEFAVETQLLSAKLLRKFTKEHSHEPSEQATIAAFNRSLERKWTAKTDCLPGYIVRDCRQYKP
jgi:hypothetical protein